MAGNPVCGRPHGGPLASQRELDDHSADVALIASSRVRRHDGRLTSTGRRRRPFPTERTAVITRAASPRGIGRATADRLARDGWSIAILDLDGGAAKRTAAEIGGNRSVASLGVAADVADPDSVEAAIAQVEASLPPVIGLANVAGISSPVDFLDVTLAEWDRVFDINMRGAFLVTRRVVPAMLAAGVGRIVSVVLGLGPAGRRHLLQGAYSASKAALIGFSRALARELGPRGI